MTEAERAMVAAVKSFKEHLADPTRTDLQIRAIEVRMESAGPDVSFHQCSGTRTQGGYLFFADDLEKAITRSL